MQRQWVTNIRGQCLASGVPFFFKRWGGVNRKRTGRSLDGRAWNEVPLISGSGPETTQVIRQLHLDGTSHHPFCPQSGSYGGREGKHEASRRPACFVS